MGTGSGPKFPGPSPQETALQEEQASLLRQQSQILASQQQQANLLAPILYKSAGVTPQYDASGNVVGFTENADPLAARQQDVASRLLDRQLSALKGELPDNPQLLQDLAGQESTLRESLRRSGQDITSTAGQSALAKFGQYKEGLLEAGRRADLSLAEQLGIAREQANTQKQNQYLNQLVGLNQSPFAAAGAYGQAAAGYSNPLQQLLAVRQGVTNANAQRRALNQAETAMWLGFGTDVLGSVASAAGAAASSARLKKDIAPFDQGEYGTAMKKLRDTPIARWRYKWEDDDREPHVGPILELSPKEIHVGDGVHVSLLDYAGMLHAGLKSVDRDVRTLREAMASAD